MAGTKLWELGCLLGHMAELTALPWVGTVLVTSTVPLLRMDVPALIRGLLTE